MEIQEKIIPAPNKIILKISKIDIVNGLYIPEKKNNKYEVVCIGEYVPAIDIKIGDIVYLMMGEGEYTHNTIMHENEMYIISDHDKVLAKLEYGEIKLIRDNQLLVEVVKEDERFKLEHSNQSGIILTSKKLSIDYVKLSLGKAIYDYKDDEFIDIKKDDYVYYMSGYFIAEDWKVYNVVDIDTVQFYIKGIR